MNSVADHYSQLLAPIYSWMSGSVEAAIEAGQAEIGEALRELPANALVVDLGAGFGMHAIPLARAGARVLAVDSSTELLTELDGLAKDLSVETVADDLLSFRAHLSGKAAAVLCMGDTLTHLDSIAQVARLLDDVASALSPRGLFVTTFRDYVSRELEGDARFIPVRSDSARILTCFLEYAADTITVHDLVHERDGPGWRFSVSSYRKLRLDPQTVADRLERAGLRVGCDAATGGMMRIVARRP